MNLFRTVEESSTSHACVFVNFQSECTKRTNKLEGMIADKFLDVDILQVNGDQDRHKKFASTRLFNRNTGKVVLARKVKKIIRVRSEYFFKV